MNSTETAELRPQRHRAALLRKYRPLIVPNVELNRQLVSFQGNRRTPVYGWFKYKEGFSAEIVRYLLQSQTNKPGTILDPFAGAGTTLFAAAQLGWNAVGIELLPLGKAIFEARQAAFEVALPILRRAIDEVAKTDFRKLCSEQFRFRHVTITQSAFASETECAMAGYLAFCQRQKVESVRSLLRFACLCILESVSYTRKDGQYLRWDARSGKSRDSRFNKGPIANFSEAILDKLETIYGDITTLRTASVSNCSVEIDYRVGSCLEIMPSMSRESVDFILTSPPYCNRYDYTRTYALELVQLGACDADIKSLRQAMLSCTVENRGKREQLMGFYSANGRTSDFTRIESVFQKQKALHEVLAILESVRDRGELNNPNICKMVRNYFYEMAFVVFEMARVLSRGGKVVMVNDNVRYAGEEIPVDLILSDFASEFGLKTINIWTLSRGKGNSSQQMGEHGRSELRKCVYVWEKT